MRLTTTHVNRLFVILGFQALAACSGTHENSSEEETTTVNEELLATLSVGDRQLKFYQHESGMLSIAESGPLEQRAKPLLAGSLGNLSVSEIYTRFAPAGSRIPSALTEAEVRAEEAADLEIAARGNSELEKPPALVGPSGGQGPALYTDAEQAWFRAEFCRPEIANTQCLQFSEWVRSNWDFARLWGATGFVNTGGATSTLKTFRENQSAPLSTDQVAGGFFVTRTFVWRPNTRFFADLRNAGPFQVSLATFAVTPYLLIEDVRDIAPDPSRGSRRKAFTLRGVYWNGDQQVSFDQCYLDTFTSCQNRFTELATRTPLQPAWVDTNGNFRKTDVVWDCWNAFWRTSNGGSFLRGKGNPSADIVNVPTPTLFNCQ